MAILPNLLENLRVLLNGDMFEHIRKHHEIKFPHRFKIRHITDHPVDILPFLQKKLAYFNAFGADINRNYSSGRNFLAKQTR